MAPCEWPPPPCECPWSVCQFRSLRSRLVVHLERPAGASASASSPSRVSRISLTSPAHPPRLQCLPEYLLTVVNVRTMEQEQSNNITQQPQTTHHHNQLWITNLWRFNNPPYSLERNRHAQREEKDTIDERTEDFGALPAVRVGSG